MRAESPVEKFSGYVILPDFLNILQVRAFEDAYFGDPNELNRKGKKVFLSVSDEKMLPVILSIVQEWHIEGQPEKPTIETFVMSPVSDGHEFVRWLGGLLYNLWKGETEVPNA